MKISVVLHHVHRGQLPHVSPGSWKTEVVHICVQYWQYSSSSFFCELFCYNPLRVPRAIVPFRKTTHWKIFGQKVWTFH